MRDRKIKWATWLVGLLVGCAVLTTACTSAPSQANLAQPASTQPAQTASPWLKLPRVRAEQRLFLPLQLDFLGEYQLPKQEFQNTRVGGLSALVYDRQQDLLYALSDDRSEFAPARFYTLKLSIDKGDQAKPQLKQVSLTAVTLLKDEAGEFFAKGRIDPEGMALSPLRSLFIASEGISRVGISPFVQEFDLQTGQTKRSLPIPKRYLPDTDALQTTGVQDNLGFEALTINPGNYGSVGVEPFRLFTATESALIQDQDVSIPETRNRMLHYMVEAGKALLISEHLYPLAPVPEGAKFHGLAEIQAIDQGGHFLSLERSFGLGGSTVRLFQLATGGASDTSQRETLKGELRGIAPIRKQLLLDLKDLGIYLDNLEGMTLGPRLPDGSQSLLLVSDDNFRAEQVTQFLLFRLRGLP